MRLLDFGLVIVVSFTNHLIVLRKRLMVRQHQLNMELASKMFSQVGLRPIQVKKRQLIF